MAVRRLPRWAGGLTVALALCQPALSAEPFQDSFDAGLDRWQRLNPGNWEVQRDGDNPCLALVKSPALRPGVRRPAEYALVKDRAWRDVTIDLRVKSLRPSTLKGRDCVVIFGFQDDTHFYYVHLSNDANGSNHNVVMKVDGDQRTMLQTPLKPQPRLSDGWHKVRVKHLANGEITVWMDDLDKPLMQAKDTRYPQGAVGVGSFDDTAAFDDVKVVAE
jgi:hypothetical protein